MLKIHRSHRTEHLVEALVDVVRVPLQSPFSPETIVVQSLGMERWLSLQLASRLSIWANPDFPFPRLFLERMLRAATGPVDREQIEAWHPERLTFEIARSLPALLERREFEPLSGVASGERAKERLLEVARSIAQVFDQYLVYRPDLLLGWERSSSWPKGESPGVHGAWQCLLWRELVKVLPPLHFARRMDDLLARGDDVTFAGLPSRICLFGAAAFPPRSFELLRVLKQHTEVHVFVGEASPAAWRATSARRMALRDASDHSRSRKDLDAILAATTRHPLLRSWGKLSRELQVVLELDLTADDPVHAVDTPFPLDSLLRLAQGLLFHDGDVSDVSVADDDESIVFHACHGPLREVEVLHDQLVAFLEDDPTLEPRDILVMAPDIETYAPYVEAVFGAARGEGRALLPFHVADRGARGARPVIDAFFRTLDVLESRFTAPEVLDLLAAEPVRRRFGIAAEDLDTLSEWVLRSGIRWGIDEAHRSEVDQPSFRENTWRFGLDRLLLGFALPGEADGREFNGCLPFDEIEGGIGALLGRFAEAVETLASLRAVLQGPRTVARWAELLTAALDRVIDPSEGMEDQRQLLRTALAGLGDRATAASYDVEVSAMALRSLLEGSLARSPRAHGFLDGGVTFCQMIPLRSIPFRVICLLGMNDGAFPRQHASPTFDLMARAPRPLDRTRRDDDRQLFLEALSAARDRFVVTYAGQSLKDNSPLPPSVLVNELADGLADALSLSSAAAFERLFVRHPLKPFSPRYFLPEEPRLFSHSIGWRDAARALVSGESAEPRPFAEVALPVADPLPVVELDDLAQFLVHPTRYFLQRVHGIYLGTDLVVPEPREPLSLDALERWQIGDALLRRRLLGQSSDQGFQIARGQGTLPLGAVGALEWQGIEGAANDVVARCRPLMEGTARVVPIDLEVGSVRLVGEIGSVFLGGPVTAQYSKISPKSALVVFVRHLAWLLAGHGGCSVLFGDRGGDLGKAGVCTFAAVPSARETLGHFVELFLEGQRAPLPFFPDASFAYAREFLEGKKDPLESARSAFENGYGGFSSDRYVRQAFSEIDPLDPLTPLPTRSFADLARSVASPLLVAVSGQAPEGDPS